MSLMLNLIWTVSYTHLDVYKRQDMNTLFPGSKDGTVGEYTAAKVMKDIEGADICVDVHSSSVYIKEIPQVRVNSDVASDLAPYVACMNVDVVWIHPSSTVMEGSLAHALNEIGVKSMVVESGVCLLYTSRCV